MNILRNFEAVFILALGAAVAASSLAPQTEMESAVPATSIATASQMAVVTVPAKRMSALEKQRSLEDERAVARQVSAAGSRI